MQTDEILHSWTHSVNISIKKKKKKGKQRRKDGCGCIELRSKKAILRLTPLDAP